MNKEYNFKELMKDIRSSNLEKHEKKAIIKYLKGDLYAFENTPKLLHKLATDTSISMKIKQAVFFHMEVHSNEVIKRIEAENTILTRKNDLIKIVLHFSGCNELFHLLPSGELRHQQGNIKWIFQLFALLIKKQYLAKHYEDKKIITETEKVKFLMDLFGLANIDLQAYWRHKNDADLEVKFPILHKIERESTTLR